MIPFTPNSLATLRFGKEKREEAKQQIQRRGET